MVYTKINFWITYIFQDLSAVGVSIAACRSFVRLFTGSYDKCVKKVPQVDREH